MATSPASRDPERKRVRFAAIDTAQGQCSRETAQQLTAQLQRSLETSWQLLREAFERRAWAVLGYPSWDSYCAGELSTGQYQLSRELRQEVVVELTSGEKPMSNRAIAKALGVSPQTVINDRAKVSNSGHLLEPELEVVDAEIVEDTTEREQEKVTGADGKTYPARQQQTKTRRRPLPDAPERRPTEPPLAIPQPPKRGPRRKHLRMLEDMNAALDGLAIAVADITELDNTVTPVEAEKLMPDLTNAIKALNQLKRQLQQRLNDQTERTDK
jgi:hypothetical protein